MACLVVLGGEFCSRRGKSTKASGLAGRSTAEARSGYAVMASCASYTLVTGSTASSTCVPEIGVCVSRNDVTLVHCARWPQGLGVYFFKNGDKYQGEWIDNKRVGRGRMEYVNGDVYDGEWAEDVRAGAGVLILGTPCCCSVHRSVSFVLLGCWKRFGALARCVVRHSRNPVSPLRCTCCCAGCDSGECVVEL